MKHSYIAMFWPDVIDLKSFYNTRLGQIACRTIRRKVREFWPQGYGEKIVGIGFATPFLVPYLDDARLTGAFMPASQGVIHWPSSKPNMTLLTEEGELPLPDSSVGKIMLVHSLENSYQTLPMLQECWRVLEPGGKILCIVPNRRGIWARIEHTPFGQGQPFSSAQLKRLLEECQFTATRHETTLFMPPSHSRFILKTNLLFEKVGSFLFGMFGGVIVMEAGKQIYAVRPKGKAVRVRERGLAPAPQPALGIR